MFLLYRATDYSTGYGRNWCVQSVGTFNVKQQVRTKSNSRATRDTKFSGFLKYSPEACSRGPADGGARHSICLMERASGIIYNPQRGNLRFAICPRFIKTVALARNKRCAARGNAGRQTRAQ